jgi:hypothetical protein
MSDDEWATANQCCKLLGMGYSSISVNGIPTPMENMRAQGLIKKSMFSFFLSKQTPHGSELTIGGYDESHFTGDIHWHPVTRKAYWEIAMDSVMLGDEVLDVNKAGAVVDTGTSLIAVPKDVSNAIHKSMGGFPFINGLHLIRCKRAKDLTFNLGGKEYTLTGEQYVMPLLFGFCATAIVGMNLPGNLWILGDTFLRQYYSVYDLDNNRVGFAPAV